MSKGPRNRCGGGRRKGPRDRCGVKVGGKDPGIDVELGRRKGPRDRCGAR